MIPSDWEELLWSIAYSFHFPPSEIWEMEISDLIFWNRGTSFINEKLSESIG